MLGAPLGDLFSAVLLSAASASAPDRFADSVNGSRWLTVSTVSRAPRIAASRAASVAAARLGAVPS